MSSRTRTAAGQDWIDYDDEDDAYDISAASKRELVEVFSGSGAAAGYGTGIPGGYGGSGSGTTLPYGGTPQGPGRLSPPPVGVLSPPPPPPPKVSA